MKLSTKGRYATRILLCISRLQGDQPVPKKRIAEQEGISTDYIEQIIVPLKNAGLVNSVRGLRGGFRLAKDPADRHQKARHLCNEFSNLQSSTSRQPSSTTEAPAKEPVARFNRAACLAKLARWSDAVKEFSEVIYADPNDVEAMLSRGEAYLAMGELRLAHEDFNAILSSVDPADPIWSRATRQIEVLTDRASESSSPATGGTARND